MYGPQNIEQLSRTEQREDDRLKFRAMAEWHRSQLKELVVQFALILASP